MIDDIDIEILNIIQNNGRIANAELARRLGNHILSRGDNPSLRRSLTALEDALDATKGSSRGTQRGRSGKSGP